MALEPGTVNPSSATDARRAGNAARVLAAAWSGESLTATAVMAHAGGTRQTALAVCDDLVARGWLDELPESTPNGQGGRPARRFALRRAAGVVVGVDAGAHAVRVTVLDLSAQVLTSTESTIDVGAGTEERVARIRAAVAGARAEAADGVAMLGLCIGVPAPVDVVGVSPEGAFWQRMNPDLAGWMRADAPIVMIENDANVAAVAEHASGAGADVDDLAYMLAGERLGAGLILGGQLVRGHGGLAGELAVLDFVEGVGSAVGLGVLAAELAARAASDGAPARRRDGTIATDAESLLLSAAEGDVEAATICAALGARLARIAAVVAGISGARRVVLGGALAPTAQPLVDAADRALDDLHLAHRPEIVAAELGAHVVALGAAQHALRRVRLEALALRPTAR